MVDAAHAAAFFRMIAAPRHPAAGGAARTGRSPQATVLVAVSALRHRHRACGLRGEQPSAPIIVLTQVLARLKIKLLADMF